LFLDAETNGIALHVLDLFTAICY